MDIYNNHKRLFGAAIILFIGLTLFAAVLPALNSQNNNAPLPESKPLTSEEVAGKGIFIREGVLPAIPSRYGMWIWIKCGEPAQV